MTKTTNMKVIEVVAAVIYYEGKYLATQRGYGDYKGQWEFPGGKIEQGEAREEALIREIREELRMEIVPERWLCTTEHDYPTFHLTMHCYLCRIVEGMPSSPSTWRPSGSAPKSCTRWSGYRRMWR